MAIWAIAGVGMLVNTIQSLQQNNQANQMQQDANQQLQQLQNPQNQAATSAQPSKTANLKSIFNFEGPTFPQENFDNLQEMQMGQAQNRQLASTQLQGDLQDMKTSFFQDNHYGTEQTEDGKTSVVLTPQGQPQVQPGAENTDQKTARVDYETMSKTELADKHADEKQNFLKDEKQTMQDFLTQNKANLDDPAVHAELQKMVVTSKKKALQLQQNQEDERYKVDMPPDAKIAMRLQQGTQGLHQMDNDHIQAEEDSPDAKELMAHDQKVAAILGEQKEKARQDKKDDEFLLDPRKMLAARDQANNGPKDVGDHLPAYLAAHMYEMGVYSV